MKKNLFILILFSLLPVITWAQESISVKGVVFDNLNMTVPGASVVEKGTQNGTVTDMDGNFTLQAKKGSKLVVSFIGYKTVEITATDKQVLKSFLMKIVKHWMKSLLPVIPELSYAPKRLIP